MVVDYENLEDFSDIDESVSKVSKDTKIYISHSLSIAEYVSIKLGNTPQKKLADDLKKTQPEISKWLSGTHNLTLRTISKLEAALDIEIINPEIIKFVRKHLEGNKTPIVQMISRVSENKIPLTPITHNEQPYMGLFPISSSKQTEYKLCNS